MYCGLVALVGLHWTTFLITLYYYVLWLFLTALYIFGLLYALYNFIFSANYIFSHIVLLLCILIVHKPFTNLEDLKANISNSKYN